MDRSRWLEWRHTIPTEVAVLSLLILVASFCCLLWIVFPISDDAPIAAARTMVPFGFVIGIAYLVAGPRTPEWALHAGVGFVTLCASILVAQAGDNGVLMMIAWCFAWMAVYVAIFFRQRAVRIHVAVMTVALGVAIVIANLPGTLVEFAIMSTTLWTGAIALGAVSERLRSQAHTDHLTGLLNRNGFTKAATRELALAGRTGYPLAIALIDLDNFKAVNDRHGHAAGDRLLVELAGAWEAAVRPGDLIARHGGDEFVVMFPATSEREAHVALGRMRRAHHAAWSAGVAAWKRSETLDETLARADARLYEAKAARERSALVVH